MQGGVHVATFLWKSQNLQESVLSFLREWVLGIENLGRQAQWQVPLHADPFIVQDINDYSIDLFCTYILFQERFESTFRNIKNT